MQNDAMTYWTNAAAGWGELPSIFFEEGNVGQANFFEDLTDAALYMVDRLSAA